MSTSRLIPGFQARRGRRGTRGPARADEKPHERSRWAPDMRHTLGFGKRQDGGIPGRSGEADRHSTGMFEALETCSGRRPHPRL